MGITAPRDLTVTFGSVTILTHQMPDELLMPVPEGFVTPYQMSTGESGPGLRVLHVREPHISNTDLEITFRALTATQISQMYADYLANRTIKTYSVTDNRDESVNAYKFVYQKKGFIPRIVRKADHSDPAIGTAMDAPLRPIYVATCRIHILEKSI